MARFANVSYEGAGPQGGEMWLSLDDVLHVKVSNPSPSLSVEIMYASGPVKLDGRAAEIFLTKFQQSERGTLPE
jgi:hypothetical protein